MNKQYVAICEKVALTIEEAAEYSNIGQNRKIHFGKCGNINE